MKLLRYGPRGQEKPGILDADGQIRDLSGVVGDLAGDVLTRLPELAALDTSTLPVVARAFRQRGEATPLLAAVNDTDAVIIPFPGLVRASLGGSVLFH